MSGTGLRSDTTTTTSHQDLTVKSCSGSLSDHPHEQRNSDMTTDDRLHERRQERIAAGRAAYADLHKHEHFKQWLAVADALVAIREEAMEQARTNRPQGPPYRAAFKAIIEKQETWVAGINDSVRAHCYWLVDTLPAVMQWREGLTFEQRDDWNHPSTIKRNFERMTSVKKARERQEAQQRQDSLADRHIALQEQHTALLALRGGAFPNDLTPEALADLCADHRNTDWLRRLVKALAKRLEVEERQDRIEAGVKGKRRKESAP